MTNTPLSLGDRAWNAAPSRLLEKIVLTAAILLVLTVALLLVAQVLVGSKSGLDLTDEGFYLLSMAHPWNYHAMVSQFGFIYHPLYKLLEGNITLLRQVNYLLTLSLASCLTFIALQKKFEHYNFRQQLCMAVVSAAVGSSALLINHFELAQSPSYNTLLFQSMLLFVIGLILMTRAARSTSVTGATFAGIAWSVAFLVKPTTAALLIVWVLFYLLLVNRVAFRLIFFSFFTALASLILFILVVDGSVQQYVGGLVEGLALGTKLSGDSRISAIWRWDSFELTSQFRYVFLIVGLSAFTSTIIASSSVRAIKYFPYVFTFVLALANIAFLIGPFHMQQPMERYAGTVMLAVPVGILIAIIFQHKQVHLSWRKFALAALLVTLPHLYAFGTDRPYWLNAEGAAFFWILSGLVLLSSIHSQGSSWAILLPVTCISVLGTSLFILSSAEFPMRQSEPLHAQSHPIRNTTGSGKILVAADLASYIASLRDLLNGAGFQQNDPLVDLTGHSPGAVYLAGGTPPGVPWLLGGYPGSRTFAAEALSLAGCEVRAKSWVITEPGGPDSIPNDVLHQFGLDLERDFQYVGTVATPQTTFKVGGKQLIWKPLQHSNGCQTHLGVKEQVGT
jgi:hypothetical protein